MAVSDAVVVEVVRVGDERLIISETLRLSLNVEILILRTKKNIICDTRGAETLDAITHLAKSGSVDSALARANRW